MTEWRVATLGGTAMLWAALAGASMGAASADDEEAGEHVHPAAVPAGIHGAWMPGAGQWSAGYMPMFMHMAGNYIGSSEVSAQTIVTTVPTGQMRSAGMMGGGASMSLPQTYRVVPTSMDMQAHMLHVTYGVTDRISLLVMADYQKKSMDMTTFAGMSGTMILGASKSSIDGLGDTTVSSLWRVYEDPVHHIHLNLGLSLPSGSATRSMTMLSPMNMTMTMRASYGMQLGTGTVDLLPGATYAGHIERWSWGGAWRSRVALDDNSEGYHYGTLHELTGWGGYAVLPGISTTVRVAADTQNSIHGSDPMIGGLMQGTNPRFYGGKHVDVLGGLELAGSAVGLPHAHLALEGGGAVHQDLNGPQLGRSWQISLALGAGF